TARVYRIEADVGPVRASQHVSESALVVELRESNQLAVTRVRVIVSDIRDSDRASGSYAYPRRGGLDDAGFFRERPVLAVQEPSVGNCQHGRPRLTQACEVIDQAFDARERPVFAAAIDQHVINLPEPRAVLDEPVDTAAIRGRFAGEAVMNVLLDRILPVGRDSIPLSPGPVTRKLLLPSEEARGQ